MYLETTLRVEKQKSELGAKTGFRVEFVEIEVTIYSPRKWYREFEETSVRSREWHLEDDTDYGTYSAAQPDAAAKNIMFASVDSQQTCYEYVPRQSCIAAERTKNCWFSGRTQRHSLPKNAGSAQPRR